MTTPATIEGTRRVDPPADAEPSDTRSPTAEVEAVTTRLLLAARVERRKLMAQLAANGRTILHLESALAGIGVEVGDA